MTERVGASESSSAVIDLLDNGSDLVTFPRGVEVGCSVIPFPVGELAVRFQYAVDEVVDVELAKTMIVMANARQKIVVGCVSVS